MLRVRLQCSTPSGHHPKRIPHQRHQTPLTSANLNPTAPGAPRRGFFCKLNGIHATNRTVKFYAFMLTLVLWIPYLQGGLHALACCCNAPAEPVSCCAAPAPQHDCECAIQSADATPAQSASLPDAPRTPQTAYSLLPAASHTLFRTTENTRAHFPYHGNDPPGTRTAFLQIWRC